MYASTTEGGLHRGLTYEIATVELHPYVEPAYPCIEGHAVVVGMAFNVSATAGPR
jgi:hypothetical protein